MTDKNLDNARRVVLKVWDEENLYQCVGCYHSDDFHYHDSRDAPIDLQEVHTNLTIDHPFMHSLIKGLDISQGQEFMKRLAKIIVMDTYKKDNKVIKIAGPSIYAQCASVDQLVLAYAQTIKGNNND